MTAPYTGVSAVGRHPAPWRGYFASVDLLTQYKHFVRPVFRITTKPGETIMLTERDGKWSGELVKRPPQGVIHG